MDRERILTEEAYCKSQREAERLLENGDRDAVEDILQRLEEKLAKVPKVGKWLATVPVMISLIRSYIRGEYTALPLASAIGILGGLLYVLSPADLIPDVIPGVGYLDDAAVIAIVFSMVEADVEAYRNWQNERQ